MSSNNVHQRKKCLTDCIFQVCHVHKLGKYNIEEKSKDILKCKNCFVSTHCEECKLKCICSEGKNIFKISKLSNN
jgi:hypothetical protein